MSQGVVLLGLSLFLAAFLNLLGGVGGGGKGGKKGLKEKSLLICAYDGDKRRSVYVLGLYMARHVFLRSNWIRLA